MLGPVRVVVAVFREFVPSREVRALIVQALGVAAVALALGLALYHRVPASPPWARAQMLERNGDPVGAEREYFRHLRQGTVTVPLLIAFFDNHAALSRAAQRGPLGRELLDGAGAGPRLGPVVTDAQIERLLASPRLSRDTALVARFHWGLSRDLVDEDLRRQVTDGAAAEPPMRWANHVLGIEALGSLALGDAADRFAKEGIAFGREEDVQRALALWVTLGDWDTIGDKIRDPRWDRFVPESIRHEHALQQGDWTNAAKWLFLSNLDPRLGPLLLAGLAALMWILFIARLGKVRERLAFRASMLAVAFVLGVASIAPTLVLITIEDHFLHLRQTGEAVGDALYFVAGVGFREELAKLVAFAPLLLVLSKWGTRLDVLACGAMVGLGFAAEENLGYIEAAGGGAAIGRFLTANFLHMAMTAICAEALADFVKKPESRSLELTKSFLTVVALHGAYDFFLASPVVGDLSFLSSLVFVLLTRQFLGAIHHARGRADAADRLTRRLVQAVLVVLGASFVYVCAEVGPGAAALLLAIGLLSNAIIVYMFVHETQHA